MASQPSERPSRAMYCRRCFYNLRGLPDARCPECGTTFDPNNAATFSKVPNPQRLKELLRRAKSSLAESGFSLSPADQKANRIAQLSRKVAALTVENEQIWNHFTWMVGMLVEKEIISEADIQRQFEHEEWGTQPAVAAQDGQALKDGEDAEELAPSDDLLELKRAVEKTNLQNQDANGGE